MKKRFVPILALFLCAVSVFLLSACRFDQILENADYVEDSEAVNQKDSVELINAFFEETLKDPDFVVTCKNKDGEVQFVIYPSYIDETDAQSNEIGGIMVVSDQFTHNGIGVGSNVNDILKANPNLEVTFYDDQYFRINDGGITYLISSEAYDGPLPEVPFDIPAPVENPTFKPDAKVSSIWISPMF